MDKITTFLTFEKNGAEAVHFYTSIFRNSKINSIHQYEGDVGPMAKGQLLHASFELDGHKFMAMDGGAHFKFDQGFSLFVNAETQDEIDRLSASLADGGGEQQPCGWVKDRYGISWQIVPPILGQLMSGPDRERAGRVMQAMLKMTKLDIQALKDA